jgi:hypothetical protein
MGQNSICTANCWFTEVHFYGKLERQNMLATQKLLDITVSKYDTMLIFHKNQTSKLSIFD